MFRMDDDTADGERLEERHSLPTIDHTIDADNGAMPVPAQEAADTPPLDKTDGSTTTSAKLPHPLLERLAGRMPHGNGSDVRSGSFPSDDESY